ncbi:MAG: extracellular solute-binding protein [Oscillospiraceae bacterium]|nr:extracellular solute-binding protein [Oscillospiraceae bacterium]
MRSFKWAAALLTAALLAMLGACATGGGPGGIIPKETVELVVYSQLANYAGAQIGWGAELLKENFNVKFTVINEMDGTFATRMAAGNLGDIVIFGTDGSQYLDAVNAGMLYDWDEDDLLKDFGPYIYENMPFALEKNRNLSGGLYGFGHNVAGSAEDHEAFFYYPYLRWDLYNRLGRPDINTLEDFIPILEQMAALEPVSDVGTKTYGVSFFPDWDGDMVMMVKSTGALYGYDEFGFGLYDTKTQTFEDCLKEGGMYLRALKFYNTLYQKGLVDPDSMTQTFNDMIEKYKNGVAFFNIFSWMADPYNTPTHMEMGKAMQCVAAKDQRNIAYGLNVFGQNRVISIGAKTNYPELCMMIVDWLCTPDGLLSNFYGPKGATWDYDDDGNTYLTDLGVLSQRDKKTTQIPYGDSNDVYENGEFQFNYSAWIRDAVNPDSASGQTFNWEFWASTQEIDPTFNLPVRQSWRDWSGGVTADDYLELNGHLSVAIGSSFSMGTRDTELDTTWEQVKLSIRDGSWKAIYAASDAEFDAIVAKMTSDARAYGYDKCTEWTQNEALRRKAAEDEAKK